MKYYYYSWILLIILALNGCGSRESKITHLQQLAGGKTFAVPTGTVADQMVLKRFPDAKIIYFNSVLDCALAVKEGKADAAVYDKPVLKNIAAKNEGITVLTDLLMDDRYGFAVQLQDSKLKATADSVLAELKAKGIYDQMMKRWFPEHGNPAPMPAISFNGANGILKFGTAAVTEPMSFFDANHHIVGFDIEFASYIAQKLGKKLEIIDMEFGAMLPALISGKVNMIGAGLSITEERAKKVLFTQSYYPSGIAALVRYSESIPSAKNKKLRVLDDIRDKRIGVLIGSIHDAYATKTFPQSKILEYQNVTDMLNALNTGKADVVFFDHVALKEVFKANDQLAVLAPNIFTVPIAAGFNKEDTVMLGKFNSFLKEIKSKGVYDDMQSRWMEKEETQMPEILSTKRNGILKVGVVSDLGFPFSIMQNGKLAGFDIELSTRFAAYLGKEFVPVDMPFGSLIASISTKKIDLITASMMITDERKKRINFSDPYYVSGVSVIAKKDNIEAPQKSKAALPADLEGAKIGIMTGTIFDPYVKKTYPKAEILRYETTPDLVAAMASNKIDAAMFEKTGAGILVSHNPEWGVLREETLRTQLGMGFNKNNPTLREQFNNFLKEIRANGVYDSIHKRWLEKDAEKAILPPIDSPGKGKILRVGISIEDLPYVSLVNGKYVGFDIEIIRRFAAKHQYVLQFTTMNFSSLLASLATGKVDMISDGIAITEERAKKIDFSDSYGELKTVLLTNKKNIDRQETVAPKAAKLSFLDKISTSAYNNLIKEKRYMLIINGLAVTIIISVLSALFGTILGGLICFLRMSKKKVFRGFAGLYITLLRGTPVLVLLMIIYYVVFASVNINPVIAAVVAFSLNFGAYVSEMFRTSIESIDKGQKEAGIASGFTKIQTFLYIIFPQALRRVLPVYKGEFISLVKMTSIVGYIAVQDLTKAGDIIRSRTFDAFFPLIMAAVIYLILAWLLTQALDYIEFSVQPKKSNKREVEVKS